MNLGGLPWRLVRRIGECRTGDPSAITEPQWRTFQRGLTCLLQSGLASSIDARPPRENGDRLFYPDRRRAKREALPRLAAFG